MRVRASTPFSFFTAILLRRRPRPYAARGRGQTSIQSDRGSPRPRFFESRPKMEVDYRRDRQNGHRGKNLRGLIAAEAAEHHEALIDARDISEVIDIFGANFSARSCQNIYDVDRSISRLCM